VTHSIRLVLWTLSLSLLMPVVAARAEPQVGTLHLDGLSFVSFGNQQLFSIPLGSAIQFEFEAPREDGSVPFTIHPSGVAIEPIPMSGDYRELRYSLASSASGFVKPAEGGGRRIEFTASVRATLVAENGEVGSYTYTVPFTTEDLVVDDTEGDVRLAVSGMRVGGNHGYVQIVGAVTNREQAFPEPGTAVYTILSGRFDRIP
jgi:hypothetical protein